MSKEKKAADIKVGDSLIWTDGSIHGVTSVTRDSQGRVSIIAGASDEDGVEVYRAPPEKLLKVA